MSDLNRCTDRVEKELALWHRKMVALGYPDAHHRYVLALWRLNNPHSYTGETK